MPPDTTDPTEAVYVTVHHFGDQCGPVLRCTEHPEWEVDVDGASWSSARRLFLDHEHDHAIGGADDAT